MRSGHLAIWARHKLCVKVISSVFIMIREDTTTPALGFIKCTNSRFPLFKNSNHSNGASFAYDWGIKSMVTGLGTRAGSNGPGRTRHS